MEPSSAVPPWKVQRPRRSGAQRRAQYDRAHAKAIGHLLKAFAALQHRGCSNTKLGAALAEVLCPAAAAAAASTAATATPSYPTMPPGVFFSNQAPPLAAQPIMDSKGIITVPLRAISVVEDAHFLDVIPIPLWATRTVSRQPSVKAELFQVFKGEIDVCVLKGAKPRTQYEQQRLAKAVLAMEILNLLVSNDKANG